MKLPAPLPWKLFTYSLADYPFPSLVAETLGVCRWGETDGAVDLTTLAADLPRNTWQTDQTSRWHDAFYAGFAQWRPAYDWFVREVVAPRLGEPCYYQHVPTFRVQLPGNVAVGELHTDAQYHHPLGEETFWLPLTDAYDTCSVWIADDDDELRAVIAKPGEVAQFSAVSRLHGNRVNETGHSRVSFDFRLLPVRLLPQVPGPGTKHTGLRFVPGEYYATEVVG